ncbi:MAG: FtsW/RodA/SpoVE family cell cycle protein [Bryobacteraceae bacterium]
MAQKVKTDSILFLTVLGLVAAGTIMLASASSVVSNNRYGFSGHITLRQLGWALAAIAAMMFFKRLDYRRLNSRAVAFSSIAAVLGLLMLVYWMDPRWHRWIRLGPIGIQPSELAKPALILFLAHFVARRAAAINDRRTLLRGAIIVGLVAGGVMVADLGTALVLALTGAVVFFVAGLEWRYAAVAGGVLLVFVSIAILTKPYRIARIFSYIDSDYSTLDSAIVRHFDPDGRLKAWLVRAAPTRDSSYHINQSLIAVGSGGPLGVGPMRSRQKLLYLPEAHTDFIYAVIAEELGLWGALLFAGGFFIIAWRGLRIHFRAPDDFGRFVALGVTTMIAVQAFMNISVVLGMVPPKGIPLPLVSYGGSSLLSTLAALGMLQSVGDHSG